MDFLGKFKAMRGALRKRIEPPAKERFSFIIKEPDKLIVLPDMKDPRTLNVQYPLIEPYASAHIKWSDSENAIVYSVTEPTLDDTEKKAYGEIVRGLVELLDVQLSTIKDAHAAMEYVEDKIHKILDELPYELNKASYNKIMYHIYRDFVGLNRIEPIMHDPYIEDVGCDGFSVPVFVIHKKYGSLQTNVAYEQGEELREFVIKMAERCGRYISYAEPLLDGSLPDGTRVQATLSEDVTTRGPTYSLRKFTKEPLSPIDQINLKTTNAEIMGYLWFVVEHGVSILICGGTATGKTTFLNSISLFIPPEDKIISIEDTRELQLPHENWIPAVARLGFGAPGPGGERYGEVKMFDLLKESFRQNPDYVIVGEVRGEEAYVMFQGMASGHPSIGTMHAAGVDTVIKRLQSPPINLSPTLVEILDLVVTMIHAGEKGKSARRVKNIVEIQSVSSAGEARTSTVFRWVPTTDGFEWGEGNFVMNKIAATKGIKLEDMKRDIENRRKVVQWMVDHKITHWKQVADMISEYHRNPAEFMARLGI